MRNPNEILDRPYRDNGAYRVPEEYFSTLNKRIMDAVDAEEAKKRKPKIWQMPHFRYAAAASIAAMIMGLGALTYFGNDIDNAVKTATNTNETETMTDEYVKECMDYAMVDNNDVYMYVAEQ